jgi:hypothetical protein
MNPWNKITEIELNEDRKRSILEWRSRITSASKPKRNQAVKDNPISNLDEAYLKDLYYEKGIGIKILARAFNLSYSDMRVLLKNYAKIEFRKCNESTEFLRKVRSDRVKGESNPWYDWPSNKPKLHKTSRGIQGYFIDRKDRKIWLRSSWEYIYASWLDQQKIDWEYEDYGITISNGERYRPDFLIYENGILTKIVEIKGYFDNRRYKAEILKNDLAGKVEVIIIDDISDYATPDRNTETWKKVRKLEK